MIRPKVRTSGAERKQFAQKTAQAAGRAAEREAERMGQRMVEEAVRLVKGKYPRRETDRRKKNTTHLEESFTYRVIRGNGPGGFPYRVELSTKSGVNAKKVAALNFGSRPHPIHPQPPKTKLAWKNASGSGRGKTTVVSHVGPDVTALHPGTKAGRFMEEARDIAVREARGRRV